MICPDDFSIEYSWQSGSVPPPYYFEYTVNIQADGHAWVTLLPDYPQHNPQPRRAEFFVPRDAMERLYETMQVCGLFEHTWKDADIGSGTGGETACLTIHRSGQILQVPHVLSMVDGLRFSPVYEAIRGLAADAIENLRDAGETE